MEPTPQYGRLTHYISRRETHILKLAMISSVSAEHGLRIRASDFERAKHWLLTAEALMPDVFRAMVQKSDIQLIKDLHFHIYGLWSRLPRDKRKPVHEREIWAFLEDKAPSDRAPKILEAAIRAGWLARATFPNEYIPRTLDKVTET